MTQESEQLDAALFPTGAPTDSDAATLLAQYKIFVETSETLGARRQGVNTFFLSVNSLVLAAVGLLLREGQSGNLESGALIGLGVGGVTLCFVWRRLIASFRQLSRGKFDVIHALERRLPAQIFKAEWIALGACAVGRFRLSTVENQIQYFAHSAEIVVICPIFTHGKQRHVGRCPMKIFYGAGS